MSLGGFCKSYYVIDPSAKPISLPFSSAGAEGDYVVRPN